MGEGVAFHPLGEQSSGDFRSREGSALNRLARAAWYPLALAAVAILAAGVPAVLSGKPIGVTQAHLRYEEGSLYLAMRIGVMATVLISGTLSVALAVLVFRRRARSRMGLFLSYYLLGYGILLAGPIELLQPVWQAAPWVNSFVLLPIFTGPATVNLFATFPSGRFEPGWSRWLILLSALSIPAMLVYAPRESGRVDLSGNLAAWGSVAVVWIACFAGMVYAQIYRYRYVSTEEEKRQTRWVLYGLCLWLIVMLATSMGWFRALSLPAGSPAPGWLALVELGWVLSTFFFPISLSIAILRHRLFDIDLIINRTLVYGVLTVAILALYGLIVGAAGLVVQANARLAGLLVTLAIVGVSFTPLKTRLQGFVDKAVPVPASELHMSRNRRFPDGSGGRTEAAVGPAGRDITSMLYPLARSAWYPVAGLALVLFLISLPGQYLILEILPHSGGMPVEAGSAPYYINILSGLLSIFAAGLSLALAVILFRNRPDDGMALFLSYYLLAHGVIIAGTLEALEPFVEGIAEISVSVLSTSVIGPLSLTLLALFPDGRFVPRWTRWVVLGSVVFVPLGSYINQPDIHNPAVAVLTALAYLVFFGSGAAMIYAQIYRQRHLSGPVQRQQTKWFVYGFGLWIGFAAVSSVPYLWLGTLPEGQPPPVWAMAMTPLWWLSTAIIPTALSVAVLRYRLYDIDLLINRTLLYGALTASVVAVYALVVGGLGVLFQSSGNLVVSLLATGLVAVLFQPLRQRLQGGVNRLMFGEREDPVSVLSTLGRKLEETVSPEEALQSIAETIALSLKLPYAAVEFEGAHDLETAAAYGRAAAKLEEFPISYQSEQIGKMIVSPRSGQEELGSADRLVLESIARQAGTVVQAAKLTADLQQSRMDLVAAREEERRRLRRDLHDGLGPQLASQSLTLEAIERRLKDDPEGAASLLSSLKEQARSAVRDIRQLVYELRPPALDELGLAGAIEQLAGSRQPLDLELSVVNDGPIAALPAAVEVAAYRIAQESITNVIRHSGARICRVEITHRRQRDRDLLCLTVSDDGRGLAPGNSSGVGLVSMRERAQELGGDLEISDRQGGGTVVKAVLPFPEGSS